jgi:hypothetical protein
MALTANDYIRPVRMIGGGSTPVMAVNKESATTWLQGDLIVGASGYAVEGTEDVAAITVLGIALEDAVSGKLTAQICPALPNVVFWGRVATGDSGATASTAVTNRYASSTGAFELSTDDTVWYVNLGETDTGYELVMILNLIDAAATAWGAVEFVFVKSAFIPTT